MWGEGGGSSDYRESSLGSAGAGDISLYIGVSGEPVQQENVPPCLHIFTDKIDNRGKEVSTWSSRRPIKHKTIEESTYQLSPSTGVLFCTAKEEESNRSESKSEVKRLICIAKNSSKNKQK